MGDFTTLCEERPNAAPHIAINRHVKAEADRFARTTFRLDPSGSVKCVEVKQAYHNWCRGQAIDPLPDEEIGAALYAQFTSAGLRREGYGSNAAIAGINWRDKPLLFAAH